MKCKVNTGGRKNGAATFGKCCSGNEQKIFEIAEGILRAKIVADTKITQFVVLRCGERKPQYLFASTFGGSADCPTRRSHVRRITVATSARMHHTQEPEIGGESRVRIQHSNSEFAHGVRGVGDFSAARRPHRRTRGAKCRCVNQTLFIATVGLAETCTA